MAIIVTSADVLDFFSISKKTLSNWRKSGCPRIQMGQWDLKQVFEWWWENLASDRAAQQGGDKSINEAKRIYWWEKARTEEFKNKQLDESLVPQEEILKGWNSRVMEVTSGLSALTDRLPPLLEGKDQKSMREVIADETWKMRDHFYRQGKFCPAPENQEAVE